jgi:FtsP/CotA-like multicopper oxidase with cupredoxin domain
MEPPRDVGCSVCASAALSAREEPFVRSDRYLLCGVAFVSRRGAASRISRRPYAAASASRSARGSIPGEAILLFTALLIATILWPTPGFTEPRAFDLSVRGGQLPPADRVIRVHQGDDVTLKWTTDRALTIHLHGYDIEQTISPSGPTTMRFPARATGRFPIEAHGGPETKERTLTYLEVHPR